MRKEHFMLGYLDQSIFFNLLIVIVKNYIYKCKLQNNKPNLLELKIKIKNYYTLEVYIARKNNKAAMLEEIWAPLKTVFPDFDLV